VERPAIGRLCIEDGNEALALAAWRLGIHGGLIRQRESQGMTHDQLSVTPDRNSVCAFQLPLNAVGLIAGQFER